jgi:hypothetical protein
MAGWAEQMLKQGKKKRSHHHRHPCNGNGIHEPRGKPEGTTQTSWLVGEQSQA